MKANKATVILNDNIFQLNLINIYKIFYPKIAQYTFFSSSYGIFYRIGHIMGHRTSLNKFKRIYGNHFFSNTIV